MLRTVAWAFANWMTLILIIVVWPSPVKVLAGSVLWLFTCLCAAVSFGKYMENRNE